jgi:hypothetical protein
MAHDHSHGDRNAYYLNQLFTIAVCGALGGVAVMLWYSGKLSLMLHPKFFIWVLLGGLTLLTLVVIRALAVWRSVDAMEHTHDHDHEHCGHDHGPCHHDHDHDHGHEHGIQHAAQTPGVSAAATPPASLVPAHHHDHGHDHAHDHGHDHDHGWAPWRYVVLLLPVVLFFLNLPNQGFSGGTDISEGIGDAVPTKIGPSKGKTEIGFAQLQQASLTAESRDFYEGKSITLVGKYVGNNPKRFTLERYKIACCAADAVPLNAVIMLDPASKEKIDPDHYRNKWVEVQGRVHFFPRPNSNEYITALILFPTADEPLSKFVQEIPPPSNPFLN